jgi:uncharacterized protein YhaN
MKIEQIVFENFGVYARKTFSFSAAPLVLIYGPNESGKTTALNGIRQALCGYRPRTPYLIAGRTMSADIRAQLADGRRLEFTRRKGRQDDVSGLLDSKPLGPEEIRGLLCDLDLDSYEQLFGFSLDELRKGETALRSARLSDALASGGLGGMTALQQLRADLDQSLAELYKPRGSTSQINVALSQIEQSHQALRSAQVLPSAVDDLRERLAAEQQRSQSLKERYADAFQRRSAAQRTLDAVPTFRQWQQIERQLAKIDIPPGIDMAFVAQWNDYADRRVELAKCIEQETMLLDQEKSQLGQFGVALEVFEFEREIEQLGLQSSEIASQRIRLDELTEQYEDASSMCVRLLENLELPAVTEKLRDFAIGAPARREIESLSAKYVARQKEMIQIKAKLEAAQETLFALEALPEQAISPDQTAQLSSAVAKLADLEQDFARKASVLADLLNDSEFAASTKRLITAIDGPERLEASWAVPSHAAIVEHGKRTEELQRHTAEVKQRIAELERQIAAGEKQLEELTADSLATTHLQRAQEVVLARNALIDGWLDELSEPLIAASVTPEKQIERLLRLRELHATADELQGKILSTADSLAASNQCRERLEQCASELASVKQRKVDIAAAEDALRAEWVKLWGGCPFEPRSIEQMLEWSQDFSRWLAFTRQQDQARRSAHIARGLVRAQRTELQELWPDNIRDDVATEVLREQVRGWEAAERDAARDRSRLATARAGVQNLQRRLAELQSEQQQVSTRYAEWLNQSPVDDWPIEQVSTLLDLVENLRREDKTANRTQKQLIDIGKQIENFAIAVKQLADKLDQTNDDILPEARAAGWLARLQQVRDSHAQRIRLTASVEHRTRQVADWVESQRNIETRLAALCDTAGSRDAAAMGSAMERVRQAEQLKKQHAELSAALDAFRGSQPHDVFHTQLEEADETRLALHISEWTRELAQLDVARKESDERVGSLTQQIEHLANSQAAQESLQQLHSQRGELAELADQWVVERLAQELLTRSIERFAADHEPALLMLSRQFLSKLTGGKYTSIEHDSANPGSFLVRNTLEESFSPARLSTGTREQLYLAIRMAFITYHCQQHEPMPVVMDDCFVNFDDQRTRLALEAIADWDTSIQTILLSCHGRVVQFLAEVAPDTPVLHLDRDQQLTAAELADAQLLEVNPKGQTA